MKQGNLCKGTPIIFRSQIARTVLQNSLSNNSESLNITVLSILEDYFALKSSVEGPTKDTKSPDVADLTGHAVKYESDGFANNERIVDTANDIKYINRTYAILQERRLPVCPGK